MAIKDCFEIPGSGEVGVPAEEAAKLPCDSNDHAHDRLMHIGVNDEMARK